MRQIKITIISTSVLLCIAFTNCSQVGEIALSSKASPLVSETVVEDIISNCQKAQASGKLLTTNRIINFEDTRLETKKSQICEFANPNQETASGNFEMHNTTMQSRYEQERNLDLPAGAVICDIEMQNNLQSFRYDDVFFFSFNGFLLATNNNTAVKEALMPETIQLASHQSTSVYTYDWSKLQLHHFENQADDYCLGASEGLSSCSWPVTEQEGQIKFNFAQSLLIGMSAGISSSEQKFSFAITGDNDPKIDCYHEKLEFSMNVKYYIP